MLPAWSNPGRVTLAVVVVASSTLAGCLADVPSDGASDPDLGIDAATRTSVVIADVGQGTNPYHEVFRRPAWTEHPSARIAGFPVDARALELTLGDDYAANLAADAAAWDAFEEKTVYWVPGTNLLLYTHRPNVIVDGSVKGHAGDVHDHGVMTSHAVTLTCPSCYVLVVQDGASLDGDSVRAIATGMPWVDVVTSTSYSDESAEQIGEYYTQHTYASATRALAESGRTFFAASGNTPVTGITPVPYHPTNLPPWVVTVGGAYAECSAVEPNSGKPPDFVGEFVLDLATAATITDTRSAAGTSFATPWVAGAFAQALASVREATRAERGPGALAVNATAPSAALEDGHLTTTELLAAFNGTAAYFDAQAYTSGCGTALGATYSGTPAPPQPWTVMGWGYVGPNVTGRAVDVVLGKTEEATKPPEAHAFMDAVRAARAAAFE